MIIFPKNDSSNELQMAGINVAVYGCKSKEKEGLYLYEAYCRKRVFVSGG